MILKLHWADSDSHHAKTLITLIQNKMFILESPQTENEVLYKHKYRDNREE